METKQALQEFETARLSEGYAQSTLVVYMWLLGDLPQKQVAEITLQDLRKFMLYLRKEKTTRRGEQLSPSSVQNGWKAVRSFFSFCVTEYGIPDPSENLAIPHVPKREIQPLKEEQVKALLNKAGKRNRAIILVLLDTGLRVGELCRAKVEHLDQNTGALFIEPYGSGRKTKSRTVFLSQQTLKEWKSYNRRRASPLLFSNRYSSSLL
jgi:integrase